MAVQDSIADRAARMGAMAAQPVNTLAEGKLHLAMADRARSYQLADLASQQAFHKGLSQQEQDLILRNRTLEAKLISDSRSREMQEQSDLQFAQIAAQAGVETTDGNGKRLPRGTLEKKLASIKTESAVSLHNFYNSTIDGLEKEQNSNLDAMQKAVHLTLDTDSPEAELANKAALRTVLFDATASKVLSAKQRQRLMAALNEPGNPSSAIKEVMGQIEGTVFAKSLIHAGAAREKATAFYSAIMAAQAPLLKEEQGVRLATLAEKQKNIDIRLRDAQKSLTDHLQYIVANNINLPGKKASELLAGTGVSNEEVDDELAGGGGGVHPDTLQAAISTLKPEVAVANHSVAPPGVTSRVGYSPLPPVPPGDAPTPTVNDRFAAPNFQDPNSMAAVLATAITGRPAFTPGGLTRQEASVAPSQAEVLANFKRLNPGIPVDRLLAPPDSPEWSAVDQLARKLGMDDARLAKAKALIQQGDPQAIATANKMLLMARQGAGAAAPPAGQPVMTTAPVNPTDAYQ